MKYPILYAKDATDFFSLGLGVLTNTLEAKVTEERNGSFFLEAKVLTDTEMYKKIELDSLIKADAGASLKDQRFRVKRVIENHDGTADIYAEHISYLTQELSLKPRVLLKGNGTGALNQWANAIIDKHPFVTSSTVKTESQTSLEIGDVDNAREALGGVQGSILDKWGGEYLFDNYHIALKEKRGKTANTLIAYGRNITDFEQEKNIMSTYTSLFPYARYTDDDQNEHLVTLPEYLVDSEYVNNYPNRKALPVDFSSEFEGKDKPTPTKLKTLAERYIKDNEVGIPKVSIQVSFLDLAKTLDYKEMAVLEELNLCDDVRVEYPKLGVSTVSKVVKIVWDVLADRYDTIEIGAKRTTLGTTIKEQNDTIKEIEKNSNNAQLSADGKNMIFYGLYGEDGLGEPTATKVGDLWYKPNGDYTIMYVWNGTVWEQVLNTEEEALIKDELEQMDKDVQSAKDKADEVAVSLVEVQKDADEAKASAEQSKVDAGKAMVDANKALADAGKALNSSNENKTSISGLTVKVDEVNAELELKASKQDLNKLDGTVKNQQTQISQNATDIKTKASQSEVNTLKGTVTNQQTQITQNANEIKQKASQSLVDSINNKVTNQQAQINLNSENIKLKAEKSEVTNLKNELDRLEIGGTNLLRDTKDFSDNWVKRGSSTPKEDIEKGFKYVEVLDTWKNYIYQDIPLVEQNAIYTLSFYAKAPRKANLEIKDDGINNFVVDIVEIDEVDWKRYSVLFSQPKDITKTKLAFHTRQSETPIAIKKIKLEKGNRATDWSPAPEDLASQSDVTSLSASIDVQANQIKNLVTKTDGHSTQLANLTIEADRISSQVVDLQNEEIGTNNLLRNSDFNPDEYGVWATSGMAKFNREDVSSGKDVLTPRGKMGTVRFTGGESDTGALRQEVRRGFSVADKTYSLSFYHARGNNLTTSFKVYLNFRKGGRTFETVGKRANITSVDNFTRYTETFKTTVADFDNIELVFEFPSGQSNVGRILQLQAPTLVVGSRVTDWTPGNETTYSQITQLSDDILLRVQKGDVINQINISTEGILIDGAKTHITGQTTIDNAVIKNAMIDSMSANKLTAGTIDAGKINVINLNANNITAGTLNGIYINLDKTMTVAENGSINSSYNYGDDYGNSYNARWFDGTSRYGNRYLNFLSNVYDVNSNNTKGTFRHYSETFFGSDIFKMRQYRSASDTSFPMSHLDVTADKLLAGRGWDTDVSINFRTGDLWARNLSSEWVRSRFAEFSNTVQVRSDYGLQTGRINALSNYDTLQINNRRSDLGDFELSKDSSGRRVQSSAIYYRTYGGGATVTVTDAGTLGRITSAAKYKLDIEDADGVMEKAFKVLEINPKMWFDKMEVESIAEAMTNGELKKLEADRQIRRHHGFVADEFHEKGLDEVVIYDSKGEIEGLSYDRISMYHNVILKRQQDEIETLKRQVAKLIGGD